METVIANDVYRNEHEVRVDSLDLSVHVYGVAVRDGKALIVPQYDGYDWPGGTLELGETHIDALKREFEEETGLVVEPLKLLNIYTSFFHYLKRDKNTQSLLVFYEVEIVGGSISTAGFDEDEQEYAKRAEWVDIDRLLTMRHACSIDIASELIGYAKLLTMRRSSGVE